MKESFMAINVRNRVVGTIGKLAMEQEKVFLREGKARRIRVEVIALSNNNTILAGRLGEELGGHWDLPGGGIDEGETVVQAGLREMAEEAGWDVSDVHELPGDNRFIYRGNGDDWFKDHGWQEEETRYVLCKPIEFNPGNEYGKEGDQLGFQLVDIGEFMDSLVENIANCKPPNVKAFLKSRQKVLTSLITLIATQPDWAKW